MTDATIITLTILLILTIAILVMAGLVLSARAFTQLGALIASLGSLLEQLLVANQQVQTTLSAQTERNTGSVLPGSSPITPDNPD